MDIRYIIGFRHRKSNQVLVIATGSGKDACAVIQSLQKENYEVIWGKTREICSNCKCTGFRDVVKSNIEIKNLVGA